MEKTAQTSEAPLRPASEIPPQKLTEQEKAALAAETVPSEPSQETDMPHPSENTEENEALFVNPEQMVENVTTSLAHKEEEIAALAATIETRKNELAEIRAQLGIPSPEASGVSEDEKQLTKLKEEQVQLEEKKNEADTFVDLQEVLEQLGKLPLTELRIIIETGKGASGQEIRGRHGNLNPEIAKALAQAAEKGVTKLTKDLLKNMLGVVKGIFSLLFMAFTKTTEAMTEGIAGK